MTKLEKMTKDIKLTTNIIEKIDNIIEKSFKYVILVILGLFLLTMLISLFVAYNLAKLQLGYILAFLAAFPLILILTQELLKIKLKFDKYRLKKAKH